MEGFLNFLLPQYCIGCGNEGERLCGECFNLIPFEPTMISASNLECWFTAYYKWPVVQKLIYEFKFLGAFGLAKTLSYFWVKLPIKLDGLLIPVPIHPKRLKQRGYNQTLLLAKQLSLMAGIDVAEDIVIRKKYEGPLSVIKDSRKRQKEISGAFSFNNNSPQLGKLGPGKKIIIIDDVMTTGATLRECANVLRQNGYNDIVCLVLAKG